MVLYFCNSITNFCHSLQFKIIKIDLKNPVYFFFFQVDIPSFCHAYPTAVRPHPTNCAKYYDCSTAAFGGSQNRECPYPQLFDAVSLTCKPFTDVQCGVRYEPKAPCKYFFDLSRETTICNLVQPDYSKLSFCYRNLLCPFFTAHHAIFW